MSLNSTTLSAAIGTTDTVFAVASATGVTAPNFTTGVGITYGWCDQEMMLVTNVSGTTVTVVRGVQGTATVAHASGARIVFGLPADFSGQPVATKANIDYGYGSPPVGMRASAAQATSAVGTASSTALDTNTKAALIEVMNTLIALGYWKGAA